MSVRPLFRLCLDEILANLYTIRIFETVSPDDATEICITCY